MPIDIELFAAFIFATSLLILMPGPIVTLVIANSLKHGTRTGIKTVIGANSGTTILLTGGALGLSTVLAVAADQGGAAVVAPFLDRLQLTGLDVTIDKPMKTLGALQVAGLPTTLIIDRQGREVARLVGIAHWDAAEGVALIDAVAALGQPAG